MKKIVVRPTKENATPLVVRALEQLCQSGGGTLAFETGEYHFYEEGTRREFMAVSNNSACDKAMAFPILEMENITVDGHGSVFVFHDVVFPFMVSRSKNIVLRNIVCDTGVSPLVEFVVCNKSEDGFDLLIDGAVNPFFAEDGSLMFRRENQIVSGKNEFFSLHALGKHAVQFFATGDCQADLSNLPARLMKCDVTEIPGGIHAAYRADCPDPCRYEEGEKITSIIDGKRLVDVICLDRSENVLVQNITVGRGIGMGVVGQLSTDIVVDGFSTDVSFHPDGYQTLTADSLHFINCDGKLEIKNCTISDTMDDALNVHGMYTAVTRVGEGVLFSKICHQEQRHFNPYRPGDRLEIIDNNTFEIVAEFVVEDSRLLSGTEIEICGRFTYGSDKITADFWIENPDRMPDLHLHHNHFYNYPNIRISGGGEMLVEHNRFADCNTALLCMDLARYWYESGRVKHLVYRNNELDNCNGRGGSAFLRIGVDGVPDEEAPKIHGRIEIIGNIFKNITRYAVKAGGVKELILQDNRVENDRPELYKIN